MPLLIELKGLPLTPPPPPAQPLVAQIQNTFAHGGKSYPGRYSPSWIGASFKDPTKHPVIKSRLDLIAAREAEEAEAAAKLAGEQAALQVTAPTISSDDNAFVVAISNNVPENNKEF